MVNVNFEDLDDYLSSLGNNTSSEAYELNITNTTEDNWLSSSEDDTVGSIVKKYNIYVDLSNTIIPEDISDLDSVFEGCKYLVKSPIIPENVTNLSESFRNCISLLIAPEIPENVENMSGTFYNCKSLTQAPVIPENVTTMSYCFQGCENIIYCKLPNSVLNINSCFKDCKSLQDVTLGDQVNQMSSTFQGCKSLITGPKIPDTVINMANCFNGCTSLTTVNNISKGLTRNSNYMFKDCKSLYNGSIVRDITRIKYLYDKSVVQACGMLVDSVTSTTFGDITDLKIYTTKEFYDSLKESVESNYSDRNFSVIQVDACLDYDEIQDWLKKQPENTEDKPYVLFIGGGLTKNSLTGAGFYYSNWSSSPFTQNFLQENKYVDLINLCLSKDTTNLKYSFVPQTIGLNSVISPYITRICEIPEQVTNLQGTFQSNTIIKGFGEKNLVPETVIACSNPIQGCINLNDVYIEHHLANEDNTRINYRFELDDSTYKIYMKDYSYMYKFNQPICNARRVILECEYSDLARYLGWWSNPCKDVQLKCLNIPLEDMLSSGTSSPSKPSKFGSHFKTFDTDQWYLKDYFLSTEKWEDNRSAANDVGKSTFDLRLTELPSDLTTLRYAFYDCPISYSPTIPETVTNMQGTFQRSMLKEFPIIPNSVTNLNWTFRDNPYVDGEINIPNSVTSLIGTFYRNSSLTIMPDIPNKVTDLSFCFYCCNIGNTTTLPDSILDMSYTFFDCSELENVNNIPNNVEDLHNCFSNCTNLSDIPNIPSTVTNFQETFTGCTELKTIHNWDLDVTKEDLTMENCFLRCTKLSTIYTTSKPAIKEYPSSDLDSGWRLINVKYLSNDKYLVTCRNLKGLNSNVTIDATDLTNFYTDELLFSPRDKLTNALIEDMLDYKLPFGNGLDPSKKNFIVWATDDTAVKTNITSALENEISDLTDQINNLKSLNTSVKVIGKLTSDSTTITLSDSRITPDMLTTVFVSEYGVSPNEVIVNNGNVTVSFDEPHDEMSVGVKLESF